MENRSKYAFKSDRNEILSHHVKNILLEHSPLRKKEYLMEKVSTRTEDTYMARDLKEKMALKLERNQVCGFSSEPKEHYRPLGDPITDPQELIFASLGMQKYHGYMNRQSDISASQEIHAEIDSSVRNTAKILRKSHEYGYLKKKISSSLKRVAACKLGSPFHLANMEENENVSELLDEKSDKNNMISNGIDWANLEIDIEKRAYFMALFKRIQKVNEHADPMVKESRNNAWTGSKISDKMDPEPNAAAKSKRSIKAMEQALGIQKSSFHNDIDQRFFKVRNDFLEQEEHLSTAFHNSLKRMDNQRKTQFKRKFAAFNPGKNTTLKEDLRAMRDKAQSLKLFNDQKLLDDHPWYSEFLSKIMVSPKSELSQYEQTLKDEIKGVIVDNKTFKKSVIVNIMKTIPRSIFGREEIQRAFRFIKAKENISERDYLEAVEEAGHT